MGQGPGVAVSCSVGCRCGSDPALLWLWCRVGAVAPIQPLAWKPPYTVGVALKNKNKNKQTKQKKTNKKKEVSSNPSSITY